MLVHLLQFLETAGLGGETTGILGTFEEIEKPADCRGLAFAIRRRSIHFENRTVSFEHRGSSFPLSKGMHPDRSTGGRIPGEFQRKGKERSPKGRISGRKSGSPLAFRFLPSILYSPEEAARQGDMGGNRDYRFTGATSVARENRSNRRYSEAGRLSLSSVPLL
jgi:hypothetical protein